MKYIVDICRNDDNLNFDVEIFGWIKKLRKLGSLIFLDIYDISGFVQVVVEDNNNFYEEISHTPKESVVRIKGMLQNRKSINNNLLTGHVEIILNDFELISKASNTPFLIQNNTDGLEEIRLKYRYLDLRRENMQANMIFRSNFLQRIREYLHREKMIEIETPILSKLTPEGANNYLVPVNDDKYFSLAQSPQIYKQLLMVSGFMQYFQIARCFRNESLRLDRQPEFTQLDIELSFTNEEYIFNVIESMLKDVFLKTINYKLKTPFDRIDYNDAINIYGSDKPNLGYGYKIFDSSSFLKEEMIFKNIILNGKKIQSIIIDDLLIEKIDLKKIEKFAKDNGANSLMSIIFDQKIIGGSLLNKINDNTIQKIFNDKKIKKGTIFFDFNEGLLSNKILGAIRNATIDILNIQPNNKYNFIWVVNWPLFEFSETENRYVSMHHPFTSPQLNDENNIFNDFNNVKARSYDIVLNGFEIGGGSIRIHKEDIQRRIFEILEIKKEIYEKEFNFLIDAFKYGMPPHGGIALGIDRIIMIILNSNSIRDVIAFPKNSAGVDLMIDSPQKREEYSKK